VKKHSLIYGLSLFLVLCLVWWLWSGMAKTLLLVLGGLSCLAVVVITWRMRILDDEGAPLELTLGALLYMPWLLWEIFKANLSVAWRILHPGLPIEPTVIRIKPSQRTELGQVIYGNSITLTPGTVTIDVEGGELIVHALTREAAEGLRSGAMDRRVSRLERRR